MMVYVAIICAAFFVDSAFAVDITFFHAADSSCSEPISTMTNLSPNSCYSYTNVNRENLTVTCSGITSNVTVYGEPNCADGALIARGVTVTANATFCAELVEFNGNSYGFIQVNCQAPIQRNTAATTSHLHVMLLSLIAAALLSLFS